jgi:hypothetical protein
MHWTQSVIFVAQSLVWDTLFMKLNKNGKPFGQKNKRLRR